ncbi:MAG: NAD(P)/FAD-dependent oxidoreductase [Clostridia bacterium]|nr:NAD(P)/FAD-dependent oxidoreductase [Clostridia bacterium]
MKIVVIGAGHGGLQAAKELSKNGFEVTVYEKNSPEKVSYDWRDDVEPTVFEELKIILPDNSRKTGRTSFVAPFSEKPFYMENEENANEWSIKRNAFVLLLVKIAQEAGAEIKFNTPVESLIIEDNEVKGVRVNDKKIFSDLVIDSSGIDSVFRKEVAKIFNITEKIDDNDVFTVYRAFVKTVAGENLPKNHKKKVYLKYLGMPGISWCICEPDGLVNILIGRVGELHESEFKNAILKLKKANPFISDEIVMGGKFGRIPVRYPLTKMVGRGYATVGDAAFMTIPITGSGISNSLRAGQILADEIIKNNSVSVETLWRYQVKYYEEIGAEHFFVDYVKRTLLMSDNEDIKYIFESGIITEDDLCNFSSGNGLKLTPQKIIFKLSKCIKKSNFVITLLSALMKGLKAKMWAMKIPQKYDEEKIKLWQMKVEGLFN